MNIYKLTLFNCKQIYSFNKMCLPFQRIIQVKFRENAKGSKYKYIYDYEMKSCIGQWNGTTYLQIYEPEHEVVRKIYIDDFLENKLSIIMYIFSFLFFYWIFGKI